MESMHKKWVQEADQLAIWWWLVAVSPRDCCCINVLSTKSIPGDPLRPRIQSRMQPVHPATKPGNRLAQSFDQQVGNLSNVLMQLLRLNDHVSSHNGSSTALPEDQNRHYLAVGHVKNPTDSRCAPV